jgi:hypothetical protein
VERAEPFERAKLPMVLAAVGIVAGLAISGSLDRTPARAGDPAPAVPFGGAVVLAGWVVGIAALHRLGRAGSMDRSASPVVAPKLAGVEVEEEEDDLDAEPEPEPRPKSGDEPKP